MNLDLLDRGSVPIHDSVIHDFINYTIKSVDLSTVLAQDYKTYDLVFRKWVTQQTYNRVLGLDEFIHGCYSHGSSASFGEFINRYPRRRVRVSQSDFMLTKILCETYNRPMCLLEDEDLTPNDCLIISLPFSGNGSKYPNFDQLMATCNRLDIPVLLDASYFGIAYDIEFDLTHSCIKDFVISLSKNYYATDLRIGIRFNRDNVDDGLSAPILMANTFNKLGSYIGIQLLKNFSHHWFVDRYKLKYLETCKKFDLTPTNTLTLALGDDRWNKFQRGNYNRVCVSRVISH